MRRGNEERVPAVKKQLRESDDYVHLDRIAKALALLAIRDKNQADQVLLLDSIGFSVREIASMLKTTSNTVSVTLYQSKKSTERKPKRKEG